MTPEMIRALRLNPRIRKKLRERQADLLDAVARGDSQEVLHAASAWVELEKAAISDLETKTEEPPKHQVTFLVEESYYQDFCETAIEHGLSPGEVARRYCVSGYTFASLIRGTVRRGGSVGDWVKIVRGRPNLAELALPDFSN
ncbi:MAG: hypothetical protein ACE5FA_13570 [Dehalococcoidia bacterium]